MASDESDRKLVVTHVISGDLWAGAEAQAFQLISALQANNTISPTVVVFNDGPLMRKLETAGIPISLADETTQSPFGLIRHLCHHFRKHQTVIVHTHGFKENVLGTLAQKLSRVPKSVRTVHGNPESETGWNNPKQKFTALLDRLTARHGQDAVVAVSGQLERDLAQLYPHKTIKILNFIEIPEEVSQEPSLSRDGIPYKDVIKVGLIGRLVPVKRADLFIDTIGQLNDQLTTQVKGIVIGDGPLIEGLIDYVRQKGLSEKIEFKGFVSDPARELEQLDILLMPSDHEGIPMALLESLLAGVPVVAHNVGGIPEILDNGHCGLLVDDHTPGGYAHNIVNLLKHPELMEQYRSAGRVHVAQKFNKDKNALTYERLYKAIYYDPGRPLNSALNTNA